MGNEQFFKNIKLEYKISILLIFIGIIILIPILYIYFKHTKSYIINEHLNYLQKSSMNIAKYMEISLKDKVNLTLTLSSNPLIIQSLKESNREYQNLNEKSRDEKITLLNEKWKNERQGNSNFINSYLTNTTSSFLKKQKEIIPHLYGEIFLTNRYGVMIATTNILSTLAHSHKYWWKASYSSNQGKIFFDDRGFDESVNGYVLGIVVPIKENGEVVGILKSNMNIDGDLNSILQNWQKYKHNVNLKIVRTQGLIVAENGVVPLSKSVDEEIIQYLTKKESISTIVKDKIVAISTINVTNNRQIFGGSYSSIDHILGNKGEAWHIIVSENINDILNEEMSDNKILIIVLVLITLILIALIAILLNKYISKPMTKLLNTIESIGDGNLNIRAEINSPINEINFLANSFNTMIKNIENKELEIKRKHMEILNLLNELHLKRKEQLNQVLNSALDGIQAFKSIRDSSDEIIDFEFIFTNKRACEIIQKREDELIGKRLLEIMPGHNDKLKSLHNKSLFDIYKDVVDNGKSKRVVFYFENDGVQDWFANKSVPLEDGFVVTFSVITNEIKQRNIIAAQSKLATMGEMISAIAHQWRQPISVVMGVIANISDLTSLDNFDKKKLEQYITRAEDTLEYMSHTIDDFRNFFNKSKIKLNFNLVEKIIKSYEIVSAQLINHKIEFIFKIVDTNGISSNYNLSMNEKEILAKYNSFKMHGYPSEFSQVILNLLANAKDALTHSKSKKVIEVTLSDKTDSYEIEVKDSGIGIPKDNLSKVFEPYFTTKSELQGSGLGLYMSKMIIEDSMNGKITIDSKERIGTSIFINLAK